MHSGRVEQIQEDRVLGEATVPPCLGVIVVCSALGERGDLEALEFGNNLVLPAAGQIQGLLVARGRETPGLDHLGEENTQFVVVVSVGPVRNNESKGSLVESGAERDKHLPLEITLEETSETLSIKL
jgi:hypothetical protein